MSTAFEVHTRWGCETALIWPPLQAGSQHRSKAEPAGAVVGDKWVPSKPEAGQTTLTGERAARGFASVGQRMLM